MKARNWPGSHVVDLDLRSLAFGRMLLGLVLALDTLIRWSDLTAHYSDYGILPRRVLLDAGWNPNYLSLHMVTGESLWLHPLFALQVAAGLALAIGYRTRWATLLSWILLVSIHNRNPWLLNGGDVYLRVILFWMLFLPWGKVWSWDARAGVKDTGLWVAPSKGLSVRSFAALGLLLQVCCLYWFAALPKWHPSWVADYSAIDIALHLDHLMKPFGLVFREMFSEYLGTLTYLVFQWEVWGPFLFWFPFDRGQVRSVTAFLFIGMHVGFEVTFELGLFPLICCCVPFLLLPAWIWEVPLKKLTGILDRRLARPEPREEPVRESAFRRWPRETILGFFVVYVLAWNFGNEQFRPSLWLPDSLDWIGYTLRLDQRWNMFSPSPPYQDGWWVIAGRRRDGSTLDIMNPREQVNWDKPECIAQLYRTQRRRRWMMELRAQGNELLMNATGAYLSRQLNPGGRSLHEVSEMKFYYMLEMTEKDGHELPPQKLMLYHYYCFEKPPEGTATDW